MGKKDKEKILKEKLKDFNLIETFDKFKEFVTLFEKQNFYYKGTVKDNIHSSLYNDFKSKRLNKGTFSIDNLIFFSKQKLKTINNKKDIYSRTDLELLAGMEFNDSPTILIEFTKKFLFEIWLGASEVNEFHKLSYDYFHLFILKCKPNVKNNIKDWNSKNIYKYVKTTYKKRKSDSYFILENSQDMFDFYDIETIKISSLLKDEILDYLYTDKKIRVEDIYLDGVSLFKESTFYGPLMLSLKAIEQNLDGKHDDAIKTFKKVDEISPKYKGINGNWGESYFNTQEYKLAISKFKKSTKLNEKIDIENAWGLSLAGLKKHKKAIAMYKKSIYKNADTAKAYNNWGLSLNSLGQYKQASKKFEKVIELDPKSAKAYNNYGMALMGSKKFKEAKIQFEKAIELDGPIDDFVFNLEFAESKIKG